jgi:hypothetical protein
MSKKVKSIKYRIKNWPEYNEALANRGNVTVWISEEIQNQWYNHQHTGKKGKPVIYSDTAIETALTIREVFHLPLRQTEGFLNSLLTLMQLNLQAPDYSTLSIRGEVLPVKTTFPNPALEPIHIVVDSTGAKIYGEGEWKVRQHGWGRHRSWRKLHLAVDSKSQGIKSAQVTGNDTTDSEVLPTMIDEIEEPIDQCSGDGAYDRRKCYQTLAQKEIKAVIPPQQHARIWQHGNCAAPPLARDENLRQIRKIGRKRWKAETNYHRRSLAETCVFRLKTIFTDRVRARKLAGQTTELRLRCQILNRMTLLGMPKTTVVA